MVICKKVENAFKLVHVPFINVVIDGWKSKTSGNKYVGVRIYFVNELGIMVTKLLSVRQFDPTILQRSSLQLSKIYHHWMVWVLEEFGILDKVYTAVSDAGSDMKKCLQTFASLQWSWCIFHGLNAAVKHVYEQYDDFSALVKRVKETVNFVRQKETLGDWFKVLAGKIDGSGNNSSLKGFQEHRFTGIFPVLERLLVLFDAVLEFYQRAGRPCPVANDKTAIEEICQILAIIHGICKEAQSDCIGAGAKAIKHIVDLAVGGKYSGSSSQRVGFGTWRLGCLCTNDFLRCLKAALFDRFYKPMLSSEIKSQNYLNYFAQMFMMPMSRDLESVKLVFIDFRFGGHAFDHFKGLIRSHIVKIGEAIAGSLDNNSWFDQPDDAIGSLDASNGDVSGFSDDFLCAASPHVPSPFTRIESELRKYDQIATTSVESYADVGSFWIGKQLKFPILSRVAVVVFGSPSSSGGMERDFGSSSRLVTKERCSLSDPSVDNDEQMINAQPKKVLEAASANVDSFDEDENVPDLENKRPRVY